MARYMLCPHGANANSHSTAHIGCKSDMRPVFFGRYRQIFRLVFQELVMKPCRCLTRALATLLGAASQAQADEISVTVALAKYLRGDKAATIIQSFGYERP